MTSRFTASLTAALLPLILPFAAHAADADQALQCAAVIQLTTANWPADHPSTAQANTLKAEWLSFAETLSFPKTLSAETEIAAQISKIQAKMISMMGDQAATQAYMTGISQGCEAVPFEPLSPAVCKVYASSKREASKMMVSMLAMNAFHTKTREEAIENATETREADAALEKAETAMAHFATAGDMTKDEAMDVMTTPERDVRKARFETCLKQMG